MKTLLALTLLTLSFAASATHEQEQEKEPTVYDNTPWQFGIARLTDPDPAVDELNGYRFTITSSDPTNLAIEYALTVWQEGASPAALATQGWKMSIKFDGELKPSDLSSMGVSYSLNDEYASIDDWISYGDVVILGLDSDPMNFLHNSIEDSINYDAHITVTYNDNKEHDSYLASLHLGQFDFKNGFDEAYHQFDTELEKLGGESWLRGELFYENYYYNLPINELPEAEKPSPSDMVTVADNINMDIDKAYTLSIKQLNEITEDVNRAAAQEQSAYLIVPFLSNDGFFTAKY